MENNAVVQNRYSGYDAVCVTVLSVANNMQNVL